MNVFLFFFAEQYFSIIIVSKISLAQCFFMLIVNSVLSNGYEKTYQKILKTKACAQSFR